MKILGKILMTVAAAGLLTGAGAAAAESSSKVFGWIEKAEMMPWNIKVKAKLDSGALTSSIDARDVERFEKDGEDWVRFRFEMKDMDSGEKASEDVERPLKRGLSVRGAGGSDERPVVLLNICVGDKIFEEEFSLRDRGEMFYPVLLGRRTIAHLGLLDVQKTFMHDAQCDDDTPVIKNDPDDAGASDDEDDDQDDE
ncbi:MAG: ATP-dependent zinc protease [Halomonas subglaciescola]|nr:ATP-dependent zinc protease [Halomonas subglaciescola]